MFMKVKYGFSMAIVQRSNKCLLNEFQKFLIID